MIKYSVMYKSEMVGLKKVLSILLVLCILAALAGCSGKSGDVSFEGELIEVGVGASSFVLTVDDGANNISGYKVSTDKKTVGEALVELELIEGEEGPYGLYIKTVCGITADYNDGGKYWAFYVNGEYATSGVDTTEIDENATYSLKVQK